MDPHLVARAVELKLMTVDEVPRFLNGLTLDEALARLAEDDADADAPDDAA